MGKFDIEFYENDNGVMPALDFISKQDIKMKAKIALVMRALSEFGNLLREPYSKHIFDGVFELRAKSGSDISRVLYFFYYDKKIIVTNGFTKKTDKTPRKEIRKALNYRSKYLERRKNDGFNF